MSPFQPTLPARGATIRRAASAGAPNAFQPTLPARGATMAMSWTWSAATPFQPTLPARGATLHNTPTPPAGDISTHAPRTGSDTRWHGQSSGSTHFNPRSPHGERRTLRNLVNIVNSFQPTLPARGATAAASSACHSDKISTHAPRTGSDPTSPAAGPPRHDFNPRSPHGERPWHGRRPTSSPPFQPTLPARGATQALARQTTMTSSHFNPRSPHGERRRRAA